MIISCSREQLQEEAKPLSTNIPFISHTHSYIDQNKDFRDKTDFKTHMKQMSILNEQIGKASAKI